MEPHENDNSAKTDQNMPQNNPMNLPSPWFTSNRLNSAGPYFHPFSLANQVGQSAPFAHSEEAQRIFSEYLDFVNQNENLQPMCIVNTESKANEKMSPITKPICASENMRSLSPVVRHEVNNVDGSTKTLFKDLPLTMKQQSNMMLGNGNDAEKVTSIEIYNVDPKNTNFPSHHLCVNPTDRDQNLGQDVNDSDTNPQPKMQVCDEKETPRKRKSNQELTRKKSKRLKQPEYEQRKRLDKLIANNNALKEELESLSEECLDLTNENDSLQEELVEKYGADMKEIIESFNSSLPDFFAGDGGS